MLSYIVLGNLLRFCVQVSPFVQVRSFFRWVESCERLCQSSLSMFGSRFRLNPQTEVFSLTQFAVVWHDWGSWWTGVWLKTEAETGEGEEKEEREESLWDTTENEPTVMRSGTPRKSYTRDLNSVREKHVTSVAVFLYTSLLKTLLLLSTNWEKKNLNVRKLYVPTKIHFVLFINSNETAQHLHS